jgi:hypothetical protein
MMFSIHFLDIPREYLHDDGVTPSAIGQIVIGEFREDFASSLFEWTQQDYRRQWKQAIEQVLKGIDKTALIVDYVSPKHSNNSTLWEMYRIGETVYLQNRLLMYGPDTMDFIPTEVERFINERQTVTEDG